MGNFRGFVCEQVRGGCVACGQHCRNRSNNGEIIRFLSKDTNVT
ncbi:hypothetical protein [Anaerotignum propionicum]|nr:hypothetical protein [Anaerotignum propionicum]